MRKCWIWLAIMLFSFLLVGSAQAQMSDTELRLQAMEEKVEALFQKDPNANYDTHGVKTTKDIQFGYGSKGFGFTALFIGITLLLLMIYAFIVH